MTRDTNRLTSESHNQTIREEEKKRKTEKLACMHMNISIQGKVNKTQVKYMRVIREAGLELYYKVR